MDIDKMWDIGNIIGKPIGNDIGNLIGKLIGNFIGNLIVKMRQLQSSDRC